MAIVQADGGLVVAAGLLQVFVGKVLVPCQGEGVGAGGRQVDGPLEEAQRCGVLLPNAGRSALAFVNFMC